MIKFMLAYSVKSFLIHSAKEDHSLQQPIPESSFLQHVSFSTGCTYGYSHWTPSESGLLLFILWFSFAFAFYFLVPYFY